MSKMLGLKKRTYTRREALRGLGAAAAIPVLGCGGGSGDPDAGSDAGFDGGADVGLLDSALDSSDGGSGWATGGTAAMTDRDSYPNPFINPPDSCLSFCASTLGPCHTASPMRVDVSDGFDGLPVRLAIQLLTEACEPIVDSIVEIWHTNQVGVYSGDTGAICNDDAEDRAAGYFRGYLRTDDEGRVGFDTVFPGWYPGRSIHIHFRIMTGEYDPDDRAAASLISQLYFPDDLVRDIFAAEPVYSDMGQPDTFNTTDGVLRGEVDLAPWVCDVSQLSDGAMLASKRIVIGTPC